MYGNVCFMKNFRVDSHTTVCATAIKGTTITTEIIDPVDSYRQVCCDEISS